MPKASKGKATQKNELAKSSAPYSRERPSAAEKSALPDSKDDRKSSRKRRKNVNQDVMDTDARKDLSSVKEETSVVAASSVAAPEAGNGGARNETVAAEPSTAQTTVEPDTSMLGKKAKKDKDDNREGKNSEKLASPEPKKKKTKHELRELQARFQQAQVAAAAAQAEMQKKIEELEKVVAEQAEQLKTKSTTLEETNMLLASMDEHRSSVKEALTCGICMDIIDEPHALQCGHTACRTCLLQWFRSPTAYPAPDVEAVQPEDDLTYRTKQCHMCRENVYIRPVRVFAVASIAEAIGLTRTKSSPVASKVEGAPAAAKSEVDLWAKTFPPDTTSYVTWDESDTVWRCPKCGSEVASGECQGCHAVFSDADGSNEESGDEDSDEDSILNTSDEDSDMDVEAYRPVLRTALPGRRPARDSDDDSPRASHLLNTLDLLADEATEEEGSYDSNSDDEDRGSMESSPALSGTPTLYPRRDRELYDDDEDLEAAGDEDYESSFIDDTDGSAVEAGDPGSESEVSARGIGGEDGSGDEVPNRRQRRHDADGGRAGRRAHSSEDDNDLAMADEPTVDELRARRAARFSSSGPPVQRRSRRVIEESDDE